MHPWFKNIQKKFSEYIVGHNEMLEVLLTALLANGHALLEGLPGTGKTFSIKVLSKLLGLGFDRIQFTPDLLPSDIIGHVYYNKSNESFSFKKGPIFSDVILADEINRTPPKTQAALLEAMEEYQVTIERKRYSLGEPFFVLATQNPIELAGTYPLPEAQLDRFMIMIQVHFPDLSEEENILRNAIQGKDSKNIDFSKISKVTNVQEIIKLKKDASKVTVSQKVLDYILRLVRKTRQNKYIEYGGSPRASVHLLQLARIWAFKGERDFVIPDDIQKLCKYVLRHRIVLSTEAQMENMSADLILDNILASEEVPR